MSDPRGGSQGAQGASAGGRGGTQSADQLAELGRRMGVSDPRQLANLERAMAAGKPGAPLGAPQHLLFAVGEVICALPAESVQGVERVTEVTPVPNTASWLLGVVQVWGSIVSVVDLQSFLGLPPQPPTSRSRLLVVTTGDMSVGFLIPAVVEMHALGDNVAGRVDARAVPEWTRPFALGALQDGGRSVVVLDPARLMASEKLHRYQGA